MCGIIAHIGKQPSLPILMNGLHRLAYRGYDSAGIGFIKNNTIEIHKCKGKVINLEQAIKYKKLISNMGIAHTRWATHGIPNDINAHPQLSHSKKLAIVHNGIIENYSIIKQELMQEGFHFTSETDTEVLINLIEHIKDTYHVTLEEAVRLALMRVVGTYAIIVMSTLLPNTLIAAKKGNPLVIGIEAQAYIIASDIAPLIAYTKKIIYMQDNEIALLHKNELIIKNTDNVLKIPNIEEINITLEAVEKNGYAHFMLKEIFEQPTSLSNCLRGRLLLSQHHLVLRGIDPYINQLTTVQRIIIVSCGTSFYAGLVGAYLIEEFCRIPVEVAYASEFRYKNPIISSKDIVLAISQSGETADTLAAVQLAKDRGATILGICNVIGATLARITDAGIYIHAGPEIGVASTKAFTAQLMSLTMFALKIAHKKKTIKEQKYQQLLQALAQIPTKITEMLSLHNHIASIAEAFKKVHHFLYLGRGYNFPVALEGALKLKEISYIHAEGYPAAEMKHGPIALIDTDMPVIFIATQDSSYTKILSNIEEVKARKGKIIAIVTQGDDLVKNLADYIIEVPNVHEALMPMVAVIPLQLLAYYIAIARNCDVDQPRNLAKSVTVE